MAIWIVLLSGLLMMSTLSAPVVPVVRQSVACGKITWQDIIVFYLVNYIAHAGTIHHPAGSKWNYVFEWSASAVLLLYVGLGRSLGLVYHHFTWGKHPFYQAGARGVIDGL